jgi:hypothetical protein
MQIATTGLDLRPSVTFLKLQFYSQNVAVVSDRTIRIMRDSEPVRLNATIHLPNVSYTIKT